MYYAELLLVGLVWGCTYALMALGLTLVYGLLRILHVAQATVFTLGAYVGLLVANHSGSLALAFAAAALAAGVFGPLIYRLIYQPILDKPPTADLWAGQTDEGELGFTYERVDQLLYLLVDQRYRRDEAIAAGFEPPFVDRVLATIRRNQFKRMPPLIAKLSNRTVGYDFLYLRDWET